MTLWPNLTEEEFVGEVGERERRRLLRGHCGWWSGIWI